ncbi:MAG: carbamoyl phosphate synthase small subunit [Clostridia bacterium]|nr:carbamoyl phosphate synthase small subunit [Clostridia bacterium]
MRKAYLVLENGRVFAGARFGADSEAEGEAVFTTGMTGYMQTLSDPACAGQIVVQTFPLIGNYGIIPAELETSLPRLAAYVVREWCEKPSNFRSEGNLDIYLRTHGIPGLRGVDTRALTRMLRSEGTMRAKLSDTPEAVFDFTQKGSDTRAVTAGSVLPKTLPDARYRVALWGDGATSSVTQALMSRGCGIIVFPAAAKAQAVLAVKPDGILLSDGPGDPAACAELVSEISIAVKANIPTFGIGLGHQLLAMSQGGRTFRMKVGHRGSNQPVRHIRTGRIHITGQCHGYAVSLPDLPPSMEPSYLNLNDGSCEGLIYSDFPAFSVQFRPETFSDPPNGESLFNDFIRMIDQ